MYVEQIENELSKLRLLENGFEMPDATWRPSYWQGRAGGHQVASSNSSNSQPFAHNQFAQLRFQFAQHTCGKLGYITISSYFLPGWFHTSTCSVWCAFEPFPIALPSRWLCGVNKSPALSSGCVLPRVRLTVGRVRKPARPPVSEKGPQGPCE